MRISVVLPAPFSPTSPTISPGATSSETSSTARVRPKDFVTWRSLTSELAARHFQLSAANVALRRLARGDRLRRHRRLQLVVPHQRDDAFVHPQPVDVRLELLV